MTTAAELEVVRYTYRLRPGAQAIAALEAEWHRCRWLWNEAVHMQRTGQRPTSKILSAELTAARARMPWLREGSIVAQQQSLRDYAKALHHSFVVKDRGRPLHKSRKKAHPSLGYVGDAFSVVNGRLRLAKCPLIPVVWSRDLPSTPTSVRVFQDSLGDWYASFVVRREPVRAPKVDPASGIGIDWGVKVTATTTDPAFDLPYAGHGKAAGADLARAQRVMARRAPARGQAASHGYRVARQRVAKLHKKVARQRQHTARTWAKRVVDAHHTIAVEDFKPRFLDKSTMSKKVRDARTGGVKQELIERGTRAGRRVVLVPPAYTTMTCASCGTRAKDRLALSTRVFACPACGLVEDRDRNAARNVLLWAMAEGNHARADDLRHSLSVLKSDRPCNLSAESLTDSSESP